MFSLEKHSNLQNHRTNNSSNKTQRRSISDSDSTVRLGRRRAGRSLGGRSRIRTLAGLGIGDLLLASELSLDVLLDVLGELVAADVVGGLEVEVAGDFLEFGEVDPGRKKGGMVRLVEEKKECRGIRGFEHTWRSYRQSQ